MARVDVDVLDVAMLVLLFEIYEFLCAVSALGSSLRAAQARL